MERSTKEKSVFFFQIVYLENLYVDIGAKGLNVIN